MIKVTEQVPLESQFVSHANGRLRKLSVRFVDLARHVPIGTGLDVVGEQIGLDKIELPPDTITQMGHLLATDKPLFERYAMRDAEITGRFYQKLEAAAQKWTGKDGLPSTSSGLAVRLFRVQLEADGINFNEAFGKEETQRQVWDRDRDALRTIIDTIPHPKRKIHAPFVTDCYQGGRNECFTFGPTGQGVFNDFDLKGAYTTGLVSLRLIDFDKAFVSCDPRDFLGDVAGVATVQFSFPPGTRYPALPVATEKHGLIFPLSGESYCTSHEIEVALNMGCTIKIGHGVIFPWKSGDTRVFESFTTKIRELRAENPKGSLDEQYAKLIGNGLYGKLAQGLKKKSVFDTRAMTSVELPHSALTNEVMAAMATGFIRAVIAEQLSRIPAHRTVISVTTDGFLTDATEAELDLTGPLATRFQALCERVAPGSGMIECKHRVAQVVAMKTRGQLTGATLEGETSKPVLAKAGISPPVPKADHNRYMLELFFQRGPDDKNEVRSFVSLRQQWLDDLDLFKVARSVRMNLDFDFKRRPVNPLMRPMPGGMHLAFDTVPWKTVEDAQRARVLFDSFRKKTCLKKMDDFDAWLEFYGFSIARDINRKNGSGTSINFTKEGIVGVMRRLFLRAFSQKAWGIKSEMTNIELARWMSTIGHPTKPDEVKNAKRAKLIPHVIPRTRKAEEFAALLAKKFTTLLADNFFIDMG